MSRSQFVSSLLATVASWLCVVSVLVPTPLQAGLIIEVESKSVVSSVDPVVIYVDVFFRASGDNPPLAGYQIRLDLSPVTPDVTLGPPIAPDVSPSPLAAVFGAPPVDVGSTASTIKVTSHLPQGAETISDLEAIARIPIYLGSNIVGAFTLAIDVNETLLSDNDGRPVPYSAVHGQLRVVPEPAGLSLALLGLLALFAWGCRQIVYRRRVSRVPAGTLPRV